MTNFSKEFSKEAYAGELVALGDIVHSLEDPEVIAAITERVNRM